MKVLFHHLTPFALENGGFKPLIVRAKDELQALGIEVEYLRWYDGSQRGDILHFFGRMPLEMFKQAQEKRMKIIITDSSAGQGPCSAAELRMQQMAIRLVEKVAPGLSAGIYDWPTYRGADACIVPAAHDAQLMSQLFRVPKEKVHVLPDDADMGKELKALYEALSSTSR